MGVLRMGNPLVLLLCLAPGMMLQGFLPGLGLLAILCHLYSQLIEDPALFDACFSGEFFSTFTILTTDVFNWLE